ncbi:MAG: TIGR04053 family radical SAM/SPASM domain-containing protein [Sandaracinaceae bacterium]
MHARPHRPGLFEESPFLLFWETTRACDLVCQHCRACAVPQRSPRELDTVEGKHLLDEARAMGVPLVVLTGGDPAKRPDLLELVRHGSAIGLRMALTPSATPLVTRALLVALREAGLSRLAISLDGADAATHDAFRGTGGSYARTLEILREAREVGLTTQVNTSVVRENVDQLEAIATLVGALDVELWSVFVVVPTGRARSGSALDADEIEQMLDWLAERSRAWPFDVKTTAAPQLRRVLLQHKVERREIVGIRDGIGRATRGVNDGAGIVFVSHEGDVFPSGFLPIRRGNVREGGLARIYREDPLFVALRDGDRLGGKCGRCEFRFVCGGSRARAYATTGDALAEDPGCAYQPPMRQARHDRGDESVGEAE